MRFRGLLLVLAIFEHLYLLDCCNSWDNCSVPAWANSTARCLMARVLRDKLGYIWIGLRRVLSKPFPQGFNAFNAWFANYAFKTSILVRIADLRWCPKLGPACLSAFFWLIASWLLLWCWIVFLKHPYALSAGWFRGLSHAAVWIYCALFQALTACALPLNVWSEHSRSWRSTNISHFV